MIEAVLFDYGKVLSGPEDAVSWAKMLEITGLGEEAFHSAYWATRHEYDRGTHTGRDYWRLAGRNAGVELTHEQIEALIEADTATWTQVNQPMVDWAARLQAAATKTGILSNLGDAMTTGVLGKMAWMEEFHHKTFSHQLKLLKPEAAIYLHAIEGLGEASQNILFVDDREDNCEAARALGLHAIQYLDHAAFLHEMEVRGWGELWRTGRDVA